MTATHPFGAVKWLVKKPLSTFSEELYLLLAKAESQQMITVSFRVGSSLYPHPPRVASHCLAGGGPRTNSWKVVREQQCPWLLRCRPFCSCLMFSGTQFAKTRSNTPFTPTCCRCLSERFAVTHFNLWLHPFIVFPSFSSSHKLSFLTPTPLQTREDLRGKAVKYVAQECTQRVGHVPKILTIQLHQLAAVTPYDLEGKVSYGDKYSVCAIMPSYTMKNPTQVWQALDCILSVCNCKKTYFLLPLWYLL